MTQVVEIWQPGNGITIDWSTYKVTNSSPLSDLTVSSGLSLSGTTITNVGVISFQGSTGDITLTEGTGISISGTTLTNSSPLSDLTVSSGLTLSANNLNVDIDDTYIINNSGNLTINLTENYSWTGTHHFEGSNVTIAAGTINMSNLGAEINMGEINNVNSQASFKLAGNFIYSQTMTGGTINYLYTGVDSAGYVNSLHLGNNTTTTGINPVAIYLDNTTYLNGNSVHFPISGYPDQVIDSNLNLSVALSNYSQWKLYDNRNSNATAFSFTNGTDTTVNSSYYLTAGHFVSPSDSRLKINFKTISGTVLTDFTNIMVGTWNKQYKVIYNKKTKNNEITNESYDVVTQVGVLADSLPKLYSSVDNSGIYSIDSVKLYALFVKAVQELYENQKLIAVKLNIKLKY